VGTTLAEAIVIEVRDANGRPLAGVPLTFSTTGPNGKGGALINAPQQTEIDGLATAHWVLGTKPGTDTLTVSTPDGLTTKFVATAKVGAVTVLDVVSGDRQSATVGSTLATPIVVKAVDQYGNPLEGVRVNFGTDAVGGSFSVTEATTDVGGLARTTYKLGQSSGPQTIYVTGTDGAQLASALLTANAQ
jgi:hypothetical protein